MMKSFCSFWVVVFFFVSVHCARRFREMHEFDPLTQEVLARFQAETNFTLQQIQEIAEINPVHLFTPAHPLPSNSSDEYDLDGLLGYNNSKRGGRYDMIRDLATERTSPYCTARLIYYPNWHRAARVCGSNCAWGGMFGYLIKPRVEKIPCFPNHMAKRDINSEEEERGSPGEDFDSWGPAYCRFPTCVSSANCRYHPPSMWEGGVASPPLFMYRNGRASDITGCSGSVDVFQYGGSGNPGCCCTKRDCLSGCGSFCPCRAMSQCLNCGNCPPGKRCQNYQCVPWG